MCKVLHHLSLRLEHWALQLWYSCVFSILLTSDVQETEIFKTWRALWSLRRLSVHDTFLFGWAGRNKFQCNICYSLLPAVSSLPGSVNSVSSGFLSLCSVAVGDSSSDAMISAQSNEKAIAVIKMECLVQIYGTCSSEWDWVEYSFLALLLKLLKLHTKKRLFGRVYV